MNPTEVAATLTVLVVLAVVAYAVDRSKRQALDPKGTP